MEATRFTAITCRLLKLNFSLRNRFLTPSIILNQCTAALGQGRQQYRLSTLDGLQFGVDLPFSLRPWMRILTPDLSPPRRRV